jgi:hypothetical protein
MRAAFEMVSQMPIGTGHYELRLAVARESLSGSVHTSVDVPDFLRDKISMSGIVLSASPSVPIAPKDELRDILPVGFLPTSVRDFTRDVAVTSLVRIYEPAKGKPADASVHYTIRNDQDRLMSDDTKPVPAAAFTLTEHGARQYDFRIALPIAQLPAGLYLFTIEAAIGKTTSQRELQFRVY